MNIIFFSENAIMPDIDKDKISEWIKIIINNNNKIDGEINIIFCSDDYLLNINKSYLNKNYYTDIIAFDYCEKNIVSGDLYISLCRVEDNALKYNTGDSELFRVIIHGVLHLLGYNDKTDKEKKIMKEKESEALKILEEMI